MNKVPEGYRKFIVVSVEEVGKIKHIHTEEDPETSSGKTTLSFECPPLYVKEHGLNDVTAGDIVFVKEVADYANVKVRKALHFKDIVYVCGRNQ